MSRKRLTDADRRLIDRWTRGNPYALPRERVLMPNPIDAYGLQVGAHLVPVKKKRISAPPAPLRNVEDVAAFLGGLEKAPVERFITVPIDAQGRPLGAVLASSGTVNETFLHPREVFAPAIEARATGVIVAHNHPSGRREASQQDVETTKRLLRVSHAVGIPLLDHVIIPGDGTVTSIARTHPSLWSAQYENPPPWKRLGRLRGAALAKRDFAAWGRDLSKRELARMRGFFRATARWGYRQRDLGWMLAMSRAVRKNPVRRRISSREARILDAWLPYLRPGYGRSPGAAMRQNPRKHYAEDDLTARWIRDPKTRRGDILAWLQSVDPNGIWPDATFKAEYGERATPMTERETRAAALKMLRHGGFACSCSSCRAKKKNPVKRTTKRRNPWGPFLGGMAAGAGMHVMTRALNAIQQNPTPRKMQDAVLRSSSLSANIDAMGGLSNVTLAQWRAAVKQSKRESAHAMKRRHR